MADSFVQLPTDGTGKKVDTRTEATNGEHRQVMVIGDPATNAGVAPVDATKGLAVDLSATGANTNKLLVTPDLPSGASTAAKQPALGTAGTASTDVITVQGIASMTKLLVTPDSVALPANQSVNVNQVAGTTTDTNSGVKSAGTIRVVIATDQPALTNKLLTTPDLPSGASTAAKQPALGTAGTASTDVITIQGIASMTKLLVTPDSVALPANQSVNVNQVAGTTTDTNSGNKSAGTQRVVLATDSPSLANAGQGATGAAVPAGAVYVAGDAATALPTAASAGNLTGAMYDKFGRQVVLVGSIRDLTGTQTTTISASTSETTIVTAGAAGVFNDLVMLIISNTSASTNTRIDFRDTTAGSILFSLESIGGAAPVGFALPIPIPQTGAATNWTAQCATSTTDVRIYAVFVKNK